MPLTAAHLPSANPQWLLCGKQSGTFAESVRRQELTTDVAAALTTQIMTGAAISLQVGDIITKLGFLVGATAAGTPTNSFVALYDTSATPALLAQSADQLTAAIVANGLYELSLASPVTITQAGVYIAALMVKATTVPSLICKVLPTAATAGAVVSGMKVLASTSGSALTGTAPATWASPTTVVNMPYAVAR